MAFKPTRSSRRLRNAHQHDASTDSEDKAFFQPPTVQTKAGEAFFQPKLKIGHPDDRYEREADTVASRVVDDGGRGSDIQGRGPAIQTMSDSKIEEDRDVQEKADNRIQRAGVEEEEPVQAQGMEEEEPVQAQGMEEEEPVQAQGMEEEEPVQAQGMEEEEPVQAQGVEEEEPVQAQEEEEPVQAQGMEEEELQAKAAAPPARPSAKLAGQLRDRSGKGRKLDAATQHQMEQGFGRDFSHVNIHTDGAAVEMNQDLRARAFTRGRDIYFNAGQYRPETSEGQRLLAHELTHVVQQGAAGRAETSPSSVQRQASEAQPTSETPPSPPPKFHALPTFSNMWDNFPTGDVDSVKKKIGGKVAYDWIKNTCAIRMSRVLNYSGHPIPYTKGAAGKGVTISGADKKWYFFRITDLRNFIEQRFGPPDHTFAPPYDLADLARYQGLILFDVKVWEDATGHYSLWNGTQSADKSYFKEASQVFLWTK